MTSIQRKVVAIQVLPYTVDGNSILVQFDGPALDTCGWGVYKRMSDSMASWHEDHWIIQDALDQADKLAKLFQVSIERLDQLTKWAAEDTLDLRSGRSFSAGADELTKAGLGILAGLCGKSNDEVKAHIHNDDIKHMYPATGKVPLLVNPLLWKMLSDFFTMPSNIGQYPTQPLNQAELDELGSRLEKAGYWADEVRVIQLASVLGVVQEFLAEIFVDKLYPGTLKDTIAPQTKDDDTDSNKK